MAELIIELQGLTEAEAAEKLKTEGYNELPAPESKNLAGIVLGVFKEPMLILLLACAVLYFPLGEIHEAFILLAAASLIIVITILQEQKTEKALSALRELASPKAIVIRNGKQQSIPRREVVRGDLIVLNEGDRVPADALVIDTKHILIDESILTGESLAVRKTVWNGITTPESIRPGGDDQPTAYFGTMVVGGKAIASVFATGQKTELGKIGKSLQYIQAEDTRLKKEVQKITTGMAFFGIGVCVVVIIIYGFIRHLWLKGLLSGLTLAIAMLPEEFPVVLTIFLALGAWRMSRKNVLTRNVAVIETLGAATVLCTDKTGTITQNVMKVEKLYAGGSFLSTDDKSIPEEYHQLLEFGILASQKESADPMEKAIRQLGNDKLYETEHLHNNWELVKEYPLSPELFSMSEVWRSKNATLLTIAAKGAPEAIAELCHLNKSEELEVMNAASALASEGLRVLGVARSAHVDEALSADQHDFTFIFLGLIGLGDPVKSNIKDAIAECHEAGVRVVLITGDYQATAVSIAKQIGLDHEEAVMNGETLDNLSDKELKQKIGNISIFSRVVPAQKLRIVQALKANGEIVAMTGDGVNDAPALKAAHIGIAMGGKGTDVAREASSLVILDDNFSSIVTAIKMGRKIFDNLQNAMSYVMAIHIPIALLSLIPLISAAMPVVFIPVNLVFLELIIDPACTIVFEAEAGKTDIMHRKPRSIGSRLFGSRRVRNSLIEGLIIAGVALMVYFFTWHYSYTEQEIRALTFCTLIMGNLVLMLSNLAGDLVIYKKKHHNKALYYLIAANLLLLPVILYIPAVRHIFQFEVLHPDDIGIVLLAALIATVLLELLKLITRKQISSN
jgi:Ca2+-transporting ATPase